MQVAEEEEADVVSASAGDAEAFGRLYRRYFRVVHGVLLTRLSSSSGPSDAEDLAQEVFVVAAQKLRSLANPRAIGAWLCTIARTRAIDHLRKKREEAVDDVDTTPSAAPSAEQVLEARRALEKILALPEAYRETLVLRLVEGMSGPEIAAATGLTEGSVRVNLHRGMQLLKESMKR